jgi:hypothetical protein
MLFTLKLLGRSEKRRDDRLPCTLESRSRLALRLNPKLGRRLSVEGRGCASSLGMGFFMLSGGYLRSFFSLDGFEEPAGSCWDARLEELRLRILSVMLPRVLLRL